MATQVLTIETSKAVTIMQSELADIMRLRRQAKAIEAELKERESNAIALIHAGAEIEPGILDANIKPTERRNVAWKAICERELGAGYCNNVAAHVKPSVSERLAIA